MVLQRFGGAALDPVAVSAGAALGCLNSSLKARFATECQILVRLIRPTAINILRPQHMYTVCTDNPNNVERSLAGFVLV